MNWMLVGGAILFAVIVGAGGYLYGKSKCNKRHPYGNPVGGQQHPSMFAKGKRSEE
jgi:hypothetical protein